MEPLQEFARARMSQDCGNKGTASKFFKDAVHDFEHGIRYKSHPPCPRTGTPLPKRPAGSHDKPSAEPRLTVTSTSGVVIAASVPAGQRWVAPAARSLTAQLQTTASQHGYPQRVP